VEVPHLPAQAHGHSNVSRDGVACTSVAIAAQQRAAYTH
jgi:hypothetical protein